MAFTEDGSHLITCSEDSLVRTWSCGQLLDYTSTSALPPKPTNSWNYHTLPVTGLAVGVGGAAAYICTVSADRSLVVAQIPPACDDSSMHDVSSIGNNSGSGALATVSFPSSLTAVALHPLDKSVYVVKAPLPRPAPHTTWSNCCAMITAEIPHKIWEELLGALLPSWRP